MLFFAGPAHVGQSVTYRVTGTISTQAMPKVSTLVLTWTAPTRLYARLSGSGSAAAVSITRAADGTLSAESSSSSDAAAVAALLNQLNFPATLAARLNGSDHAQTTLSIPPPAPAPAGTAAPASTSSPAPQKSPAPPVPVPINLDLVSSSASATLIADGNSTNRGSSPDSGSGRRGGGMGGMGGGWTGGGGWRSRDSDRGNGSSAQTPRVDFALEAVFDQSGSLEHATFRETFASTTKDAQTVDETFTIDRIDK
jgi:hypothetical protein